MIIAQILDQNVISDGSVNCNNQQITIFALEPLLLIWFDFNPSMEK